MMNNAVLDCIVRFHDIRRLPELQRCVFSLVEQYYRPLNIILVLQRFTEEEIEKTRAAMEPLLRTGEAPSLLIHNWSASQPEDGRTYLLNEGISKAKGDYVAFLDYDDILFPEAYQLLVSRLRQGDAAIAFASVQTMTLTPYASFYYQQGAVTPAFKGRGLKDLFRSNFCPLHSYVLNRRIIPDDVLFFDIDLAIEEDYDLLLRLCAAYPSDFSLLETVIGYYFYKSDASNTVARNQHSKETLAAYEKVCDRIENRRRSTLVAPAVQEVLDLSHADDGRSIRDVLDLLPYDETDTAGNTTCPGTFGNHPGRAFILYKWLRFLRHQNGGVGTVFRKICYVLRTEGIAGIKRRLRVL